MSEATKTIKSLPWRRGDESAGEAPIMGADGKPVVSRVRVEPRRPDSEFSAHLGLVITAVNHFDELVAALRRLVADNVDTPGETIRAAESLLARIDAKGRDE